MTGITQRQALEELAKLEHEQWVHWAKGLLKEGEAISPQRMSRWLKLFNTRYEDLPEPVKEQDRMHARKALEILNKIDRNTASA